MNTSNPKTHINFHWANSRPIFNQNRNIMSWFCPLSKSIDFLHNENLLCVFRSRSVQLLMKSLNIRHGHNDATIPQRKKENRECEFKWNECLMRQGHLLKFLFTQIVTEALYWHKNIQYVFNDRNLSEYILIIIIINPFRLSNKTKIRANFSVFIHFY